MNNQHIKGAGNEIKGKVKQEVGHFTGNASVEGEGIVDRVKGKIQESVGDIKDAVKRGIDTVLDKTHNQH